MRKLVKYSIGVLFSTGIIATTAAAFFASGASGVVTKPAPVIGGSVSTSVTQVASTSPTSAGCGPSSKVVSASYEVAGSTNPTYGCQPYKLVAVCSGVGPNGSTNYPTVNTFTFSGAGSSSTGSTITSYNWAFSEGGTGTGITISHTYKAVGSYTVKLTVTDSKNAVATATCAVKITASIPPPPNPHPTYVAPTPVETYTVPTNQGGGAGNGPCAGGNGNGSGAFCSPITFDLNGDGVQTTAYSTSTGTFDLLGNGTQIHSGWISSGDAYLAVDSNHNGVIDSRNELFGGNYGDGFAKLATFDTNHDGVINAADKDFSSLLVWQDANGNHKTDAGELKTLTQVGITSITLAHTEGWTAQNGNYLGETTTAVRNGQNIQATDVYLATK